jgi:hypothetical protein
MLPMRSVLALQLLQHIQNALDPFIAAVASARRKFLRFFPKSFYDETYLDWERGYKWEAHKQCEQVLAVS